MTKVGEHITLDIIGATKEYSPEFYEKLVYKIAKLAKVQNHVHDLAFSQQVSARILGAGDYANLYQKEI